MKIYLSAYIDEGLQKVDGSFWLKATAVIEETLQGMRYCDNMLQSQGLWRAGGSVEVK
jgi:hypothetical protein